uniref:Uncharacterized protein n=1 Tax=Oryza punctata TaxID=4537 RepID=A0A0E0LGW0_ORYPU
MPSAPLSGKAERMLKMKAIMKKLKCVGIDSGSGMSLLRYCTTCLIFGLTLVKGWEHSNPIFSGILDWESSFNPVMSHLPDKMSGVMVPKLFADHGYRATYVSNPSLCIIASKLEFRVAGVNSGSGASPSRYCMTCRMIGLAPGIGCEHISPSVNTRHASSTL